MFDLILLTIAASLPSLITLYWICLIVGGGLLVISSLAGTDTDIGADVDVDIDLDVDADLAVDGDVTAGHAHASSLTTWFSIQFLVFFMAVFGVVGVTMTHLSTQTGGVTLAAALVGGLIFGQGVHQLMGKLRRNSGDSTPKVEDYVNKIARVTIAVEPPKRGEIALRVGRAERYIPAIAKRQDQMFASGTLVGVVGYHEGVVEIVSREEYDFLNEDA